MNTRLSLADLKLELLRKFILEKIDDDQSIKQLIASASSVGILYCELIANKRFDLFSELMQAGILPTTDELAQQRVSDNSNAWFWLAQYDEGAAILKLLFEKGIYPNAAALNQITTTYQISAWHRLAQNNYVSILKMLLEKNIYPSSEAFNQISTLDQSSAWYWLLGRDEAVSLVNILFAKDIYPSQKILNQICKTVDASAWYLLAKSNQRIVVFQSLLDKEIYPSDETLNHIQASSNLSAWYEIYAGRHVAICKTLLDKNIYPNKGTLDYISDINVSAWYWTIGDGEDKLLVHLNTLFEHDIYPSPSVLNRLRTTDKTSFWYYLAGSDLRAPFFKRLLNKKIHPNQEALNQPCISDNYNAWWWLALSKVRLANFKLLLDLGIYPSPAALNLINKDNKNVWNKLADTDEGKDIIKDLLAKNILPSVHVYHQLKENNKDAQWLLSLRDRMDALQKIINDYQIDENNLIANLFSHEDKNKFYGFLYAYYLITAETKPEIFLPYEVWLLIARYLLPQYPEIECLEKVEQRRAFVKCHLMDSLEHYSKGSILGLFPNPHRKRALSLREQIKTEQDPHETMLKQSAMALEKGTTCYPDTEDSNEKYKQAFVSKINDEVFEGILKDGCFLFKM
jgi:hypothetical protein